MFTFSEIILQLLILIAAPAAAIALALFVRGLVKSKPVRGRGMLSCFAVIAATIALTVWYFVPLKTALPENAGDVQVYVADSYGGRYIDVQGREREQLADLLRNLKVRRAFFNGTMFYSISPDERVHIYVDSVADGRTLYQYDFSLGKTDAQEVGFAYEGYCFGKYGRIIEGTEALLAFLRSNCGVGSPVN